MVILYVGKCLSGSFNTSRVLLSNEVNILGTSQMINKEFSGISKLFILFRKSGVSLINEGWRLHF